MKKQDEIIQQDVIDQLAREDTLESSTIGVAVKDGVVHLFGTVPTEADRRDALNACSRVSEVRRVVDELKLAESTLT